MNICVGLIGRSGGWEELLRQEGVPFAPVHTGGSTPGMFSAVVACRSVTAEEAEFIRGYLRSGGALLGYSMFLRELVPNEREPIRLKYVWPDHDTAIRGLSLMDVETEGIIPPEASMLRTEENVFAIFSGELLGGRAVITPFDPGQAFEDFRAAERYFYADTERLPTERVSRIGKGEVLHFLHAALETLHHARGLLYAHLGYFPAGCENIFGFRIDTDGGTRGEIDELSAIAREAGMGFTWFLDVRSHEQWLDHFSSLDGHEVGLHCYDHRVYLDRTKDAENMRVGRNLMESHGLAVRSFASPFGFWSPDFGRMMDDAGFAYSSEFSWAYDTLPHRPVSQGVSYRTLQVPVHPVSIGNLLRIGFTSGQMIEYYAGVIKRKLVRREPLFFYHHPGHREWGVVRTICAEAHGVGVPPMTLAEYAAWWERRATANVRITVEEEESGRGMGKKGKGVEVNADSVPTTLDVFVRVSRQGGEEASVGLGTTTAHDALLWKRAPVYGAPEDIRRMRDFDMRGEIGRQLTRLQRRFR